MNFGIVEIVLQHKKHYIFNIKYNKVHLHLNFELPLQLNE